MALPDIHSMSATLWSRPDKVQWLEDRGLTEDTIMDNLIGYVPEEHPRFGNCISIPYFDNRGELVTVRYRHLRLHADHKYDAERGTNAGRHLYNVRNTDNPVVAICEGEFDSLIIGQLGIPAVGIPGAQAWNRSWRLLFRNSDLVLVICDADEAGQKARNKILGQVGMITDVVAIDLPADMDVTDMYLTDPDKLRELLS
jgi:DNA primase